MRLLVLDHANGSGDTESFFVLCANCHQLKSRIFDWTGRKRGDRIVQTKERCSAAGLSIENGLKDMEKGRTLAASFVHEKLRSS